MQLRADSICPAACFLCPVCPGFFAPHAFAHKTGFGTRRFCRASVLFRGARRGKFVHRSRPLSEIPRLTDRAAFRSAAGRSSGAVRFSGAAADSAACSRDPRRFVPGEASAAGCGPRRTSRDVFLSALPRRQGGGAGEGRTFI